MVIFFLRNLSNLVGESQRFREVPKLEYPFKAFYAFSLHYRPFDYMRMELGDLRTRLVAALLLDMLCTSFE